MISKLKNSKYGLVLSSAILGGILLLLAMSGPGVLVAPIAVSAFIYKANRWWLRDKKARRLSTYWAGTGAIAGAVLLFSYVFRAERLGYTDVGFAILGLPLFSALAALVTYVFIAAYYQQNLLRNKRQVFVVLLIVVWIIPVIRLSKLQAPGAKENDGRIDSFTYFPDNYCPDEGKIEKIKLYQSQGMSLEKYKDEQRGNQGSRATNNKNCKPRQLYILYE